MQGVQVQTLVRELRSYVMRGAAKKDENHPSGVRLGTKVPFRLPFCSNLRHEKCGHVTGKCKPVDAVCHAQPRRGGRAKTGAN